MVRRFESCLLHDLSSTTRCHIGVAGTPEFHAREFINVVRVGDAVATNGVDRFVEQAEHDDDVIAVFLFGSAARGEKTARDIDVCLVLGPHIPLESASKKRLEYLKSHDLDVQIFQALPIVIRRRILKEGKVLFSKDDDALYAIANTTIRSYTYFHHAYQTYLEGVQTGP